MKDHTRCHTLGCNRKVAKGFRFFCKKCLEMTRQEAFQDTQERIIEAMVAYHNITEAQAIRYLTYVATAVDLVNGK
jgi:hypothetical protein